MNEDDNPATKGDLRALKGDLGALKGDVTALKGDVTALKGDVTALKGDLGALDAKLDTLRDEVFEELARRTTAITDDIRDWFRALDDKHVAMHERLDREHNARMDKADEHLRVLRDFVVAHAEDRSIHRTSRRRAAR